MEFSTKYKIFITSLIVWFGTLITCILSWTKSNLINSDCYIFLPFLLTFIVSFPSLIIAGKNRRLIEYDKLNPSSDNDGLTLDSFIKDSPKSFKIILFLIVVNLIVTILTTLNHNGTNVSYSYDHYVLTDANNVEKTISFKEYRDYFLNSVKIFSSFTLLFISFTVMILERLLYWEKHDLWALPRTE